MTLAQPVQALTLEDIIALTLSGYEDEAILRLIEETGSVFHLTAQDLVELHEAGVSEKVMQAMIWSGASRESQVTAEASQGREEKEQDEHGSSPERAEPRHAEPELPGRLLGRPLEWSTYSFHEDAHAGAHEHAVVAYGDIDVLVLRDEAGFSSVQERADAVAAKLASAFRDPLATFEARSEGQAFGLYSVSSADHREEKILEVNLADAAAFAKRSARSVDPGVLARWWAALLRDYQRVLARAERPREVAEVHPGEALVALYQWTRQAVSEGAVASAGMQEALASLSKTQWEHLKEMAGSVPRDFEAHVH